MIPAHWLPHGHIFLALDGLPPSVNEGRAWNGAGRWQAHKKRQDYHALVAAALADQQLTELRLGSKDEPLAIEIGYYFGPRNRRSDTVSNREKVLIDALVAGGLISDDLWIRYATVWSHPGKTSATIVKLYPHYPKEDQ